MFDFDVFVLGGGPAGLAAAIAARRAGLNVVLADAERPPIDKACGEGLMPDSLAAAAELGIAVPAAAGVPFGGIRFIGEGHTITANFPDGQGLGVRRTVLQPLLVEHARKLGVELLWNSPVTALDGSTVSVAGKRIYARWIIGADGAQSRLRRWAGLESFRRNSQRFSYRRHYRAAPWSNYVDIHWGEHCQFYVTSVGAGEVCVVLMTRDPRQRVADALPHFPALQARLAGADIVHHERGALAATRQLHRVTAGNVALIGDASGTIDPITGEGLCLAFKEAAVLARAMVNGELSQFEAAHRRLTRRPRFMADFMLLMDRSALLRRRTIAAFESHPHLFSNLLAMHVGELRPVRFAKTAAWLGWEVVTG